MIISLVTVAFLLTYLHKYTWETLARHKAIHITIGAMASLLFLVIPFIFLANVNLMQYPDRWEEARQGGFAAALFMANVIPRYLHFLLAAVASTGLFLVWYLTREKAHVEEFPDESRASLRKRFYTVALVPTLMQFLAGPLVLITLPPVGLSGLMLAHLAAAVILAAVVVRWMWQEIQEADNTPALSRRFWQIVIGMGVVVVLMATARQLYRATALKDFQAQSRQASVERQKKVAYYQAHPPAAAPKDPLEDLPGYSTFKVNCMACHGLKAKLVGPSAVVMGQLYNTSDGADDFVSWIRTTQNPRRVKAADEPPMKMPAYGPGQLDDAAVRSLHGFLVEVAKPKP
jgi:cytochrome c